MAEREHFVVNTCSWIFQSFSQRKLFYFLAILLPFDFDGFPTSLASNGGNNWKHFSSLRSSNEWSLLIIPPLGMMQPGCTNSFIFLVKGLCSYSEPPFSFGNQNDTPIVSCKGISSFAQFHRIVNSGKRANEIRICLWSCWWYREFTAITVWAGNCSALFGRFAAGFSKSLPMANKAGVVILLLDATEAQRDEKPLEVQRITDLKEVNRIRSDFSRHSWGKSRSQFVMIGLIVVQSFEVGVGFAQCIQQKWKRSVLRDVKCSSFWNVCTPSTPVSSRNHCYDSNKINWLWLENKTINNKTVRDQLSVKDRNFRNRSLQTNSLERKERAEYYIA